MGQLNARVLHWSPLPNTRALIFDCDGTLADTMPVHYEAWCDMLADHGMVFPEAQFYAMAGMPTSAIVRQLAAEQAVLLGDSAPEAMCLDKEHRYLKLIDRVGPVPEVMAIAERYRGHLPIAVASGGDGWLVTQTLTAIGVLDWIDALVCAEDTLQHKPDPAPFLEAARRLGVPPETCTVFEDSDLGLEAGRRAGMQSIDIRPWR